MTDKIHTPEFSRPFLIDHVKMNETRLKHDATEEECLALAQRFGFKAVRDVTVNYRIEALQKEVLFHVHMDIKAKIEADAGNDDSVIVDINQKEDELFTTREDLAAQDEADFGAPELIIERTIDLGELASEFLFLMADEQVNEEIMALVRKENPGIIKKEAPEDSTVDGEKDTHKPFANLKDLLEKK